ncbi:Src-like 3 domains [Teratosphaeria destructans]|uniref:Src-like 3 domains n=1 Tax=Teratosphaeria destructans TaxID=418781 RepID=A0A9W7SSX4_9PEZI|nr:Src-like 3 domains [Teratosphaeria destructans]
MARPGMLIRQDTLDLQDQDKPTAAAHHHAANNGTPNGVGAHQAAQLHHVSEERHSEEQSLVEAWNIADSNLVDEPSAIGEAQGHNEHEQANGAHQEGEDGASESEAESDDDMMDRISSSPSIDDECAAGWAWLADTRKQFVAGSFSHANARRLQQLRRYAVKFGILTILADAAAPTVERRWAAMATGEGGLSAVEGDGLGLGRYGSYLETGLDDELLFEEGAPTGSDDMTSRRSTASFMSSSVRSDDTVVMRPDMRPIESPLRQNTFPRSGFNLAVAHLQDSPSFQSIASIDLDEVLLPRNDPLLEVQPSPPGSPSGSWESAPDSDQESIDEDNEHQNDDAHDAFLDLDSRFIDFGWGGECLRDAEDIDFEFVYALHTFVATVEGQANATKGDTMVLLDDSNSYWWLVRVVKDSSIGYLPAEHIETPTERLARLNKHRNIDLSATMLSDNPEKSRNPLKKAMRRRAAKTVQFAAPTYVEASDYDWSSDEEEQPAAEPFAAAQTQESQQNGHSEDVHENEKEQTVEEPRSSTSSHRNSFDREQAATYAAQTSTATDEPQLSPKLVDKTEAAPLKSRKGTPRNTDSFLKDDSIETRKITLTPGLLREDNTSIKSASSESARNNSFENLAKTSSPPEQQQQPAKREVKEKDKKKEKQKGGMLSGLFKSKKKDKKVKDDDASNEKVSSEGGRDSKESSRASPLQSGDSSPVDKPLSVRSQSDRQRAPQTQQAVNGTREPSQPLSVAQQAQQTAPQKSQQAKEEENAAFVAELPGSEAAHEIGGSGQEAVTEQKNLDIPEGGQGKSKGPLSPIKDMLTPSEKEAKPAKAKRSKQRVELDDFDSPADEEGPNPFKEQEERARASQDDGQARERLSESPVEITNTFMHGTELVHIPDNVADSDDDAEDSSSPPSLLDQSAAPGEKHDIGKTQEEDDDPTPTLRSPQSLDTDLGHQSKSQPADRDTSADSTDSSFLSPATPQQTWSDSSLRAWYDDGSEIKDMLLMIQDKSDVKPAPADHPLMVGLYEQERRGVKKMMTDLDNLLGTYLSRKGISFD